MIASIFRVFLYLVGGVFGGMIGLYIIGYALMAGIQAAKNAKPGKDQ